MSKTEHAAYQALGARLGLCQGLSYDPKWSAAPDFLNLIVAHALAAKPANVVECSSGLTSLMLARCCEMNKHGSLFSLENGPKYAANTRREIERYDLQGYATVIDAPLIRYPIHGHEYQWYTLSDLPDPSIDMLVIDGPPGFLQHHSRYPALPLLFDRLAEGCVVFLDDAARPDEREIVEMWQMEFPTIEHEYINAERGCAILRIHRSES
jgi:predicted O-methyltransferase YrrM